MRAALLSMPNHKTKWMAVSGITSVALDAGRAMQAMMERVTTSVSFLRIVQLNRNISFIDMMQDAYGYIMWAVQSSPFQAIFNVYFSNIQINTVSEYE